MLKAVEAQRKWPQWQKKGGDFIPMPATWLNQKRWQDEGVDRTLDSIPPAEGDYTAETSLQKAVCGWKIITGQKKDDRSWDKLHWVRVAEKVEALLTYFDGDYKQAVDCMQDIYEELKKKNLDCTIETILKRSAEWKLEYCKKT